MKLRCTSLLFILCAVLSFFSITVSAQSFSGYRTSNYAGLHGALYNPASLADNRLKHDISLASLSMSVGNNFLSIDNSVVFNPGKFSEDDFKDRYVTVSDNGKIKSAYVNVDALGPGFFTALSEKDAIGFYIRLRGMANVDGVDQGTANIIWRDLRDDELGVPFTGEFISVNEHIWSEYAFPYARVVHNDGRNLIKVGGTLKLLQGIQAVYFGARDYSYTHRNRDTMEQVIGEISYGRSANQFWSDKKAKYKFEQAGIGIDLGVIYDFRPDFETQKMELDGQQNVMARDRDAYKVRIGFSITDLGTINYKKTDLSRDYTANTPAWDLDLFEDLESMDDLDQRVTTVPGATVSGGKERFSQNLPLAMNLMIDYNAGKGFFLNFNPIFALKTGKADFNKTHHFTTVALTPRWEARWFGVCLPFEYNSYLGFTSGLSLRAGPVFLGSMSLISNLAKGETNNVDYHLGVKISIPHKRILDKDKDGVSDKLDECPVVAGRWETKGCPDRDGDGVLDTQDNCPDVAGPVALKGCPDRDNDGIIDIEDACPDAAGLATLRGCPDRDGDGIADGDDKCPDLAGTAQYQGCPDRDGDGVIDPDDVCPDTPGLVENRGCPFTDSDGDGIKDQDDKCPNEKGPVENGGCPYADTDKDGVIDLEDKCPNTPGPASNQGCPVIEEKEKEILKTAFDNLEFETGKAIIRSTSNASLDELATLLVNKPEYKLLIEGHTDNVGKRESNMTLSKNRANAVKKYLQNKGVPEKQLTTKWYGPDNPIDTNSTPEGRQHNRRVEMTVVFD